MKDDLLYVGHIRDAVEHIFEYTKPGKDHFFGDTQCQDAVMMNFGIIGEATKKMSSERKDRYPEIPWKKIAGLRDVVIHDYAGMDWRTVWNIIESDLPALHATIKKMLTEWQQL